MSLGAVGITSAGRATCFPKEPFFLYRTCKQFQPELLILFGKSLMSLKWVILERRALTPPLRSATEKREKKQTLSAHVMKTMNMVSGKF